MPLNVAEAYAIIRVDMRRFAKQLKGARAQFASAVSGMEGLAAKARIGLMLGAGITAGILKAASSFEQGMARVRALTGATGSDFESLQNQAMELGRTTQFSARQAADAMGNFALAGFNAQKILAAMPDTLNLAAAGQLDVGQASDIVAKIMAGMGMEAGDLTHAVDVLTKAFTSANTDLVQLGEAMKYAGPVAKASGKSIEETVGVVMALSNAGMQATMAGNILKNMLIRLSGGTTETNKVFKQLGVEMVGGGGKMRNVADIVDDLRRAMTGKGEAAQMALMGKAFGQRAVTGMMELLSVGGDRIREFQKSLEGAGGTAKRIAEIQMNTFWGMMKRLQSALEGVAIAAGNLLIPQLRAIGEKLGGALTSLARDPDAIANAVEKLKLAMTGLLSIFIGGKLISAISSLTVALAAGGPLVAGIMAVAAALGYLSIAFMKAGASGKSLGEVIATDVERLTGLKSAFTTLRESMERQEKTRGVFAGIEEAIKGGTQREIDENIANARKRVEELRKELAAEKAPEKGFWGSPLGKLFAIKKDVHKEARIRDIKQEIERTLEMIGQYSKARLPEKSARQIWQGVMGGRRYGGTKTEEQRFQALRQYIRTEAGIGRGPSALERLTAGGGLGGMIGRIAGQLQTGAGFRTTPERGAALFQKGLEQFVKMSPEERKEQFMPLIEAAEALKQVPAALLGAYQKSAEEGRRDDHRRTVQFMDVLSYSRAIQEAASGKKKLEMDKKRNSLLGEVVQAVGKVEKAVKDQEQGMAP